MATTFDGSRKYSILGVVWIFGLSISAFPIIILKLFQESYHSRSDACLYIEFGAKQLLGEEYLFIPFLITNITALMLICISYVKIIQHAVNSSKALAISQSTRPDR